MRKHLCPLIAMVTVACANTSRVQWAKCEAATSIISSISNHCCIHSNGAGKGSSNLWNLMSFCLRVPQISTIAILHISVFLRYRLGMISGTSAVCVESLSLKSSSAPLIAATYLTGKDTAILIDDQCCLKGQYVFNFFKKSSYVANQKIYNATCAKGLGWQKGLWEVKSQRSLGHHTGNWSFLQPGVIICNKSLVTINCSQLPGL